MTTRREAARTAREAAPILAIVTVLVGLVVVGYRQALPQDDGSFSLRYAQNLAAGDGYVWNARTHDGIGASAPFWPSLIAIPILLGVKPVAAMHGVSILMSALAFATILHVAARFWGQASLIPLALALGSSGWTLGAMMGGLETPLTVLLIALAMGLLTMQTERPYLAGALAAAMLVHKIDLAPWSVGLLVSAGFWRLRAQHVRALGLALAIVVAYFAAMQVLTGHWFPVSFLRKFEDSVTIPTVGRQWFISASLLRGHRFLLVVPALVAFTWLLKTRSPMAVLLAIGIGGQLAAYSLFPPTEPFEWYTAPVQVAMDFLLSGAGSVVATWAAATSIRTWRQAAQIATVVLTSAVVLWTEPVRHWVVVNAETIENDRASAGQWVAQHTPRHFRLATGYGNTALFADRFVYDSSGLNMPGDMTMDHLIAREKPEVLIECPFNTSVPPDAYQAPAGYVVVKYFERARYEHFADFYAVVLVRNDVVDELID